MSKLKIAIQKSGRLNEDSLKLLKDCGLAIHNGKDQLKVVVNNFPVELLYLRNSDIPQYLEDGTADLGIIGENLLLEKQKQVSVVKKLGFSKCRVSLAVPKDLEDNSLKYFNGQKNCNLLPRYTSKISK
jgi:ATP phosphoribosyltransferase